MDIMNRTEVYEAAVDLLNEHGHEAEFRPDYSGRGMYGKTTPAIVADVDVMVGWAITVVVSTDIRIVEADMMAETALDMIPKRTDQMGRSSTIFY